MTEINEESLSVVLLHQRPDLMSKCCKLINEEWPRSETARMFSLRASCDKMPTSLVLLNDKEPVGHCKLTPIPSIKDSCFVESVVISKSSRGKGLGTFLMKASEEYCKKVLELKTIHLSTKGQEDFYSKLGYSVCEPVSIYGGYQQAVQNRFNQTNTNVGPKPPPMNITLPQNKNNKTFMVKKISEVL